MTKVSYSPVWSRDVWLHLGPWYMIFPLDQQELLSFFKVYLTHYCCIQLLIKWMNVSHNCYNEREREGERKIDGWKWACIILYMDLWVFTIWSQLLWEGGKSMLGFIPWFNPSQLSLWIWANCLSFVRLLAEPLLCTGLALITQHMLTHSIFPTII